MIEVYKIVSEKYDSAITPTLIISDIRWEMIYDPRSVVLNMICVSFTFTNRVVDQWNSLPNWVVTANNTQIF